MFTRIRNMHPITGIVIGVVATLVLSGTAIAVTDTSFEYSTVRTGYLMIGPGDLVPATEADANDFQLLTTLVASDAGACFVAPVHLPEGARMTSVRTSYRSGAASDLYLALRRANPVTAVSSDLIDRFVVDDSGTRTFVNDLIPFKLGRISNAVWAYTYRMCLGSGDDFFAARVAYTYTNAGD